MEQAAQSSGPWDLRSIHTNDPDSGEYDVLDAAGEPVLAIQRINSDVGRAHWKANLQLVKSAPQLASLLAQHQRLLEQLVTLDTSRPASLAMAMQKGGAVISSEALQAMADASTLLRSLADSSLITPR